MGKCEFILMDDREIAPKNTGNKDSRELWTIYQLPNLMLAVDILNTLLQVLV